MGNFCTNCGKPIDPNDKFCPSCGAKIESEVNVPQQTATASVVPQQTVKTPPPQSSFGGIWYQNHYKIRKKVLTVGNKYWIEDSNGQLLGFCKQKLFKLKEDIRIFKDEAMAQELFRIQQEQIMDAWGSFAVIDSATNSKLGYIKRDIMSAFGRDTWEIQTVTKQIIGRIFEHSLGKALARKYLPGGGLVPEEMTVELDGKKVAQINQEFKIIGDIWNMNILDLSPDVDRRVMLACMLLMGNIERDRK